MRFSIAFGFMSKTLMGFGAFSTLYAIGLPMFPTPMNPTVTAIEGLLLSARARRGSARVDDLVPHLRVLLPVLRPDLLLGHLAERRHVGLVHLHALRLEDLLGLLEAVDRLGQLADLRLCLAADVHDELLLLGREA